MTWLGITIISAVIWLVLVGFWGQFWRGHQRLEENLELSKQDDLSYPSICAIVPARNEAEMIAWNVRSLLNQNYPGAVEIIIVDDQSSDGTAKIAQELAPKNNLKTTTQLTIISGEPLPLGWTGKLWAMAQGVNYVQQQNRLPDFFLFTDADIDHDPCNVSQLVAKAQQEQLDLVSLMVLLRCQSGWEKLLIPAFVFFFQKLYPFSWVNNPSRNTAAAAGGCILIRPTALKRIGGLEVLRQALIDDCTLAQAVKSTMVEQTGGIWLGLTTSTRSLRPYPSLSSIWDLVVRTAFTQLNYSPLLLLGTLIGMTLVYLVPPIGAIAGLLTRNWLIATLGSATWLLMMYAYLPTLRLYNRSLLWSIALPLTAFLYTLMTIDSAWCYWQGRGGAWKGRVYR